MDLLHCAIYFLTLTQETMATTKTLYDLLEVAKTASDEAIASAYDRLKRKHESVSNSAPLDEAAIAQFKAVREAYLTLSNPERRKKYDARLALSETPYVVVEESAFFTPARIFLLILACATGGAYYWKAKSDEAQAVAIREAQKKQLQERALAEVERAREEREARADEARRRADQYQQQRETDAARRYGDSIARQNESAAQRAEMDRRRQEQAEAIARDRNQGRELADARRRAADDERRLRELQRERIYGR